VRAFFVAVALLLPLAAGCGSDSAAPPAGAEIAPATAEFFLSVRTDFDSEEWQQAVDVVERFPDSDRAVRFLLQELGLEDVDVQARLEAALGPETDIVAFGPGEEGVAVGLTQPEDPARLEQVLADLPEEFVTREIEGWTAFSDSEAALDRFEDARSEGTLAESEAFTEAMGDVDGDALLRAYLNGENIEAPLAGGQVPSLALSLAAEEGGVRLRGSADLGEEAETIVPDNFSAELPETIPGGVLLYVGTSDVEASLSALRDLLAETMPEFDRDLARVENELGVSLEEGVFPLFRGETALYVRPGLFIPEVTLLTEVEDEAAAVATLDELVAGLEEYLPGISGLAEVEIAGVAAKQIPITPPFALYYAAFDGRLVVTSSRDGIASLREDEDRLADDEDFRDALEQAGVPEETSGFAYVSLEDAIQYVYGFAEQAGDEVPPVVRANLEALQNLVVYSEKDGSALRFAGFLGVD
jgi:Protein of unknown function (DUF3352)